MSTESKLQKLKESQFAEKGYYVLSGTSAATVGVYSGFYVVGADTVITSITGIDVTLIKGDNDFSELTLQEGIFIPVPGNFTTMTLSAGGALLINA